MIELLLAGIEEDESMISSSHEVTQLLHAWSEGNEAERLAPLVDAELHRLAGSFFRRERPDCDVADGWRVTTRFL